MKTFSIQYDATHAVVIAETEQEAVNILNARGYEQITPYIFNETEVSKWVVKWTDDYVEISPVTISIVDSIKKGVISFEQH